MMNQNMQSNGLWYEGIFIVRIVVGIMLVVHGSQLFVGNDMRGFADTLLEMSIPFPVLMPYVGKAIELVGGFFLIIGLFTRVITPLIFATFIFITFVMGEGKIFADNQLPFMFAMFSLLFFFTGAGKVSFDYILFINRREDKKDSGISVSKRFGRYVSKS